ncbi:hypothetical protein VTN00DRAFT_5758 [Thermoascus crustaceus]|uniref:uncharacterized protein n=1 Tax=Thermoascus crustaceus TaxID=5088 RepID=UPI00374201C6
MFFFPRPVKIQHNHEIDSMWYTVTEGEARKKSSQRKYRRRWAYTKQPSLERSNPCQRFATSINNYTLQQ